MAVSKRLRFEVFRRDNHTCRYCGGHAPDATLTIDHVVPVTLGGSDEPTNLVTACTGCNSGKSSVPAGAALVADVAQDALRWSAAMLRAAELEQESRDRLEDQVTAFLDRWTKVNPQWAWPDAGWEETIEQFLTLGLTSSDLDRATNIAVSSKVPQRSRWRYFCGVCWRKLGERQEAARALLAEPATATRTDIPQTPENDYATLMYANLVGTCDNPRWWD